MNRRPKLTLLSTAATPVEAAVVVAAVEQFIRDAPAATPPSPAPAPGRWLRAARLEAVGRDPGDAGQWGDRDAWG